MFGHQVELNFNKQGSYHKTILGGLVSWLVIFLMVGYIYLLTKKLIAKEDDKNESYSTINDLDELGGVKVSDLNANLVVLIIDGSTLMSIEYDDYVKRHIKLSTKNVQVDW